MDYLDDSQIGTNENWKTEHAVFKAAERVVYAPLIVESEETTKQEHNYWVRSTYPERMWPLALI